MSNRKRSHPLRWIVPLLAVALLLQPLPVGATPTAAAGQVAQQTDATVLADSLRALNAFAAASQTALMQGDVATARAAYAQLDEGWLDIEDGVRIRSRDAYRSIEEAMHDADRALRAQPLDAPLTTALLIELQARIERFAPTLLPT